MAKSKHLKKLSIIGLIVIIVALLGLGFGLFTAHSEQEQHQIIQARNHHINTTAINHSRLSKYGSAKFIQHKNTVVFTAKPYVAEEIKHTKIGDKLPGKFSTLADKDTHSLKVHQHDAQLHEQIIPDN